MNNSKFTLMILPLKHRNVSWRHLLQQGRMKIGYYALAIIERRSDMVDRVADWKAFSSHMEEYIGPIRLINTDRRF